MITIISPGKLILSGEHAVVYGAPACALAINKTIQGHYQLRDDNKITINCDDLQIKEDFLLEDLFVLHEKLTQRYHDFINNKIAIQEVIQDPIELCWFTIGHVLTEKRASATHPYKGSTISLTSNIPLGCGMGSSAALIVNLILGVNALFNLQLSQEKIFELALKAESLQHGYSSGLDVKLSLMGGIHIFRKNQPLQPIQIASLPFQYFNSGKPESTTGECVAFVKKQNFPDSLWREFEKTTLTFIENLKNNDQKTLIEVIKKNHRLLCEIGVVPKPIQNVIAEIESQGGAAKICGAGSTRGDHAGMILITDNIHWPDASPLTNIHSGSYTVGFSIDG